VPVKIAVFAFISAAAIALFFYLFKQSNKRGWPVALMPLFVAGYFLIVYLAAMWLFGDYLAEHWPWG
jgi:predicted metal-binding membrane protein